jgi:hypothetical protein
MTGRAFRSHAGSLRGNRDKGRRDVPGTVTGNAPGSHVQALLSDIWLPG